MRISLRGRRRTWLALPAALVVAAGSGAWLLTRDSSVAAQPTTYTVTTQTVRETVPASGTIEPARRADLDFAVSGTVARVYVAEGDRVHKGQVLARVDDAALVATRNAASASLSAAYAQLDDDQEGGASDTQIAADQAAIVAAKASLTQAKQAVTDATLRATIGGTVVAVDLAEGDVVGDSDQAATTSDAGTDTTAVSIVSTGHYVVHATVASDDVKRVRKGLQAEITPTGVTEPVYGTVESVGLVAQTSSNGAAVFPVTIEVTGKRGDLYAGTSADASIVVKQVQDVLTVPTGALQTDAGGTTYVTRIVDGRGVKTPVGTGAAYGMSTEITRGLQAGDEIEIPGSSPQGGSDRQGGMPGPGVFQEGTGGPPQGPIQIHTDPAR